MHSSPTVTAEGRACYMISCGLKPALLANNTRMRCMGLGLLVCCLDLYAQFALQIQGVQPTNHPVLGAAQTLQFSVQGGSNGLVEFESTSTLGLSPVWTTRSAVPASVLQESLGSYPL